MHWFPVLERTEQHVACKGAGMHMYVVLEQAMIGKTPDRTLAILFSTLNSSLPVYS